MAETHTIVPVERIEKVLRSQIASSSWGGRRYLPYAFTEQGVAMLSTVLRSKRAVQVNIEIMRAFVRLRRLLASNEELARKLAALERKYDAQFKVVFDAIRELMRPPTPKRRKIGFLVEEKAAVYGRR
jgi:ORF6N domain